MPKYSCVNKAKVSISKLKPGFSMATIGKNIKVYFVDNDKYYDRPGLYGEKKGDYPDNLERFSYYCERTLELLKIINFSPDIIHCNDWQSSLIPVFLKTKLANDSFYKKTKTVLTIHNLAYQGLFAAEEFSELDLDKSLFSIDGFEFYGKICLLKAGILFADKVTTVSQGYADEILTKEFGCGLEAVLQKRRKDLSGIINGLDYSVWDPEKDDLIFQKYNSKNADDKSVNKKELQKLCGLAVKKDIPLLGFVGRLAEQKGVDLLSELVKEINTFKVQVVILGTGDQKYHDLLEEVAGKNPKRFSLNLKFDEKLAHRIYAGSDMFFMPSRYEPCGLGQMISFKYATIPVVYKTGGLSDTVFDFNPKTQEGNGFVFTSYSKDKFFDSIKRSLSVFADKKIWNKLIRKVMDYNFSWEESARKYIELYNH